jgi:hypothetical protein
MEDGEEKERKKKKKISIGRKGFPGPGPALLAVKWVATIRCN